MKNFRSSPLRAAVVYRVLDARDRYKRRHLTARAIRTPQGDGDTSFPATTDENVLKMSYNDYYATSNALPYFANVR